MDTSTHTHIVEEAGSEVPLADAHPGAPEWTTYNYLDNYLKCRHCLRQCEVLLPLRNDVFEALLAKFAKDHTPCKKPAQA